MYNLITYKIRNTKKIKKNIVIFGPPLNLYPLLVHPGNHYPKLPCSTV